KAAAFQIAGEKPETGAADRKPQTRLAFGQRVLDLPTLGNFGTCACQITLLNPAASQRDPMQRTIGPDDSKIGGESALLGGRVPQSGCERLAIRGMDQSQKLIEGCRRGKLRISNQHAKLLSGEERTGGDLVKECSDTGCVDRAGNELANWLGCGG